MLSRAKLLSVVTTKIQCAGKAGKTDVWDASTVTHLPHAVWLVSLHCPELPPANVARPEHCHEGKFCSVMPLYVGGTGFEFWYCQVATSKIG